jgi:5'-phosphate synthase pdxT subunit
MPSQESRATLTIGVLALQGAFVEHIALLQRAATSLLAHQQKQEQEQEQQEHSPLTSLPSLSFIEVRTPTELSLCSALILPGGESTAISLIASRCGLLEPLRDFVKVQRKPVWGTCAGLILLAESANKSKATGQELIGGLDVRVQRNYFGRQVESFEADLRLSFLEGQEPFHSVFIRAPVVERVLSAGELVAVVEGGETVAAPARKTTKAEVEIVCRLPGRAKTIRDQTTTAEDLGEDGDIVAVRQGNVFGTAFHPELTGDERIHAWWLGEVVKASRELS